ncbi:phage tail sheath family protein [Aquimarina longa]|uniref:phage tail sheath family protein n=1 Tax=Aquimarina longa TaxID=1080221 RepID=UPI0007829356|nr:phage tail sheath C-terminal domain-containing protein [Aquimarina longa]
MTISYPNTPGVKIKEVSTLPPSIVQVSTSIPAFFGYTEKGEINTGIRINSLKEYEDHFGGAYQYKIEITESMTNPPSGLGTFFFYEALRAYFMNGGGSCYIISLGHFSGSSPITEASLGDFIGNNQLGGIYELEKLDEPTLVVCPEAVQLNIDEYGTLAKTILSICANMKDRFALLDAPKEANLLDNNSSKGLAAYRTSLGTTNLSYGASYFPNVETIMTYTFDDDSTYAGTSISALKDTGSENYLEASKLMKSWPVILPSSVFMAGICANVDQNKGVWNAPANISLIGAIKPVAGITSGQQEKLNVDADGGKSINAIRSFSGKGTMVWGARTLAGNNNEWRYISVRRFFITVEESIGKACDQFVFAPNDANTWVTLSSMISSYLQGLWRSGALMGAVPEEAFFVNIGLGKTMSKQDILEGIMRVEVGLATVRPAEFIILSFTHKVGK